MKPKTLNLEPQFRNRHSRINQNGCQPFLELWVVEAVVEPRYVVEGVAEIGAHEGGEAGQEDVGDNAHGPQVGGQRDGLVVDDLSRKEYRVTHLVANLGWVDFDLGCSTVLLGQ